MALILGIESSCDESAAAVVENGVHVRFSSVATQIAKHAVHGGVVPELAAREHLGALPIVVAEALSSSGVTMREIDAVAVTQGPGLMPALLVGLNYAKGLAVGNGKPLICVNHFLAHIYGAFLDDESEQLKKPETYPILALVVSGGHTSLLKIDSDGHAVHLGCTIDDAAGEALDKGAKLLKLGYPGGPVIQKAGQLGDCSRYHFPRPLTGTAGKALPAEHRFNFSFSGIKTALLYHVRRRIESGEELSEAFVNDTAASYEEAIVDVLSGKALAAAESIGAATLVVAGGVACNKRLRERLAALCPGRLALRIAPPKYCTDNAAMVGGIAYHDWRRRKFSPLDSDGFARLPELSRVPFV